jgi:adenylyltransferase/sulfurtransferase
VVEPDGDGGAVVTVPPGAPCYACARSAGAGRPSLPGAAALGSLAATELVLLIAAPGTITGRRFDVVRGVATARPTVRLPGCACAAPAPEAS